MREHPEARRPKEAPLVSKGSLLRRGLRDEARRKVLKEAEHRYQHELLDDEERQLLLDRIRRLRKALAS